MNQPQPSASNSPSEVPSSPTGGEKHIELSGIHDFAAKLLQPEVLPRVKEYVLWHRAMRGAAETGTLVDDLARVPDFAPVSINLDITTACNYACDHCVDMDILNQPIKYAHDKLEDSLREMAGKGLKSVIVIGGGEPTVYRHFEDAILSIPAARRRARLGGRARSARRRTPASPALASRFSWRCPRREGAE